MAHGRESERVERCTLKLLLEILFRKGAEHAAAGGVDEQRDLRLLRLEQRRVAVDAVELRQVEHDGTDGILALLAQLLQPLSPPRDDPDFVKALLPVHGVYKFPPDPGGSAGDDRDLHRLFLPA